MRSGLCVIRSVSTRFSDGSLLEKKGGDKPSIVDVGVVLGNLFLRYSWTVGKIPLIAGGSGRIACEWCGNVERRVNRRTPVGQGSTGK